MPYQIGFSKYDITGPCADLGFMGMSDIFQKGRGIHTRLFSRSFVVEDLENSRSVAFVCADLGICSMAIKKGVVDRLKLKGPFSGSENKPCYTDENLMIMANHTHSGPGGYSHYHVYNLSIGGFNQQNFDCIVDGIFKSIFQAHQNKKPGKIYFAEQDVWDCGKIRSLAAYVKNPEVLSQTISPKDILDNNVEPLVHPMSLLKFVCDDNDTDPTLGMLNWFALHPTNFGQKNRLISSDNKGYAEQIVEKKYKTVIAGFANSCCGDLSPNVGKDLSGRKYHRPDGVRDKENVKIFGAKQADAAQELFDNAGQIIDGEIDYRHAYIDIENISIKDSAKRTWPAAMGMGMIQGSEEDSTGFFLNIGGEGTTKESIKQNPGTIKTLLGILSFLLGIHVPDKWEKKYEDGHGEKPILIPLGYMTKNGLPIAPSIVPIQVIKIGKLVIVGHPGELTTIAGVRLKKEITKLFKEKNQEVFVVIATYANGFCSYTTTEEEYSEQHYEGASTLYGPHTLSAFIQEQMRIAQSLISKTPLENHGTVPKEIPLNKIKKKSVNRGIPDEDSDGPRPSIGTFEQPKPTYFPGDEVIATIIAAYPNRDLITGSSYFSVEREDENRKWIKVVDDNDFESEMIWNPDRQYSKFTLKWAIPVNFQQPGNYKFSCTFALKQAGVRTKGPQTFYSRPFRVGP